LVGGEVSDSLGLEGEEEDERAGCTGLSGQRLVGQAALQELPAFIVVEQVGGFLAWDERDGELAAEAAAGRPVQEVADAVAALGVLSSSHWSRSSWLEF
jgi:predicted phage gp36 major capsid-like protein